MSTGKMKKFENRINSFSIKGVINNIRESVSSNAGSVAASSNTSSSSWFTSIFTSKDGGPDRLEAEVLESVNPPHCSLEKTLLHGYPFKPTCISLDPVQKILAIGNKVGQIRFLGKPGIDVTFQHESRSAVIKLVWVVNTGQILSMCQDDCLYLLDVKQRQVEIVQFIRFNKESLTTLNLAVNSNWVFVGTKRGNTHVLRLDSFSLSGYIINWNKAIGLGTGTHPGPVSHILENPADPSKLLIGFDNGTLCLWDLSLKKQEETYHCPKRLTSICWHHEGKQFVCSCVDGSLVTWNIKPAGKKPASVIFPHKEKGSDSSEPLSPIEKVEWFVTRDGESCLIFSGGLPEDVTGAQPSMTVLQGKHTTVIEMEFCVVDFVSQTDSPWRSEQNDPQSILVLLTNDLVAIDCKSSGLSSFENPYAMDLQESAVTTCSYMSDVPADLLGCLTTLGSRGGKSAGWSGRDWPVSGGEDWGSGPASPPRHELLVTGHADGSLRFWDSTNTTMKHIYRLRTQKLFEKNKAAALTPDISLDDDPYAITNIAFSNETKVMAVSGQSDQVVLYSFNKKDTQSDLPCLEIPIIYEVSVDRSENSPNFDCSPHPPLSVASQSSSYNEGGEGFNFEKKTIEYYTPLKVRSGQLKKPGGFQPDLVCLTPWVNGEAPSQIGCITINSKFGLLSYGNGSGLVIVDYIQHKCLLNMGTADLYGSNDPFQRMPKSPKALPNTDEVEVVKVELGNYSQLKPEDETKKEDKGEEDRANPPVSKVKSPVAKSLSNKAVTGSSAEENSLSKSRSSSVSSLDQVVESEGVTAVLFAESFANKNDFELSKCLYVGTSLGSILAIVIVIPDSEEERDSENVIVSPSGSLLRLKSSILEFSLLDSSLHFQDRAVPLENLRSTVRKREEVPGSSESPGELGGAGGAAPPPLGDQIILAASCERGAACFSLPSQRQIHSYKCPDSQANLTAQTVAWLGDKKTTSVLLLFTSDGRVKVLSLPRFRPLLEATLVPHMSARVSKTLRFSTGGLGTYFSNQNQVQKFSVNKEETKNLYESLGKLHQEKVEMPDPPKQSFFKGFFGGGVRQLDRDELFGESSGKPSSSLAQVTTAETMKGLTANSIKGESEIANALRAAGERGNKLNEVEDKTEDLANKSKIWAENSHQLMEKMKNKKWYQL